MKFDQRPLMQEIDGSYWTDGVELEHVSDLQQYHNNQIEAIEKQARKAFEVRPWTDDDKPTVAGQYWIVTKYEKVYLAELNEFYIELGAIGGQKIRFWAPQVMPKYDPILFVEVLE